MIEALSDAVGRDARYAQTTGGTQKDGPWEIDEVIALESGWRAHIETAPQLEEPGTRFRYDKALSG